VAATLATGPKQYDKWSHPHRRCGRPAGQVNGICLNGHEARRLPGGSLRASEWRRGWDLNPEQVIVSAPRPRWVMGRQHDPEKLNVTPGSVSITSGVWPDPQTSIEPVYYGVGSDVMAFMITYHQ
jgi:cholesterol oxidase